ncbi:MAG: DUF5659 domain-containing protein [Smithella sp.]|nr:DUF5659 domain-containing protein [Smithella sp.]MDD5672859.1 DUF5659 domain-containing protein [Chitinivibrionales bacterium]
MSKKYLPSSHPATIITNDLYLAAFLHCVGCPLDHVEQNERRRKSFVFIGERVRELREAYQTGPVKLDMRSFRESLLYIRRLMDGGNPEQRSVPNESSTCLQPVPQF